MECVVDFNLVVLSGRLSAPPEIREFESGARSARYLITVRTREPQHRVDVVPVTVWDPEDSLLALDPSPGTRVWAAGMVQRRFWAEENGRRSRLEVVARHVEFREDDPGEG